MYYPKPPQTPSQPPSNFTTPSRKRTTSSRPSRSTPGISTCPRIVRTRRGRENAPAPLRCRHAKVAVVARLFFNDLVRADGGDDHAGGGEGGEGEGEEGEELHFGGWDVLLSLLGRWWLCVEVGKCLMCAGPSDWRLRSFLVDGNDMYKKISRPAA